MNTQLHPYTRLAALIIGCIGLAMADSWVMTAIFELALLPFILLASLGKMLIRFALLAILPMSAMFIIFHQIFPLAQGSSIGADLFKVEKLLGYTFLLQLALVIPLKDVHATFQSWGLRDNALITAVSSYFVWNDVVQRSERILLARLSQGYVHKRTVWTKAKQLPYVIVPLVISVMRTAAERAESWEQKDMLERFNSVSFNRLPYSKIYNLTLILITGIWLIINVS